jgi:hypothetical protein
MLKRMANVGQKSAVERRTAFGAEYAEGSCYFRGVKRVVVLATRARQMNQSQFVSI